MQVTVLEILHRCAKASERRGEEETPSKSQDLQQELGLSLESPCWAAVGCGSWAPVKGWLE